MSEYSNDKYEAENSGTARQFVRSLIRFFWILKRRKTVVFAFTGVTCLLGALYYTTATRIFEANASLLIIETAPDVLSGALRTDTATQGLMPTNENLLKSAIVLHGAFAKLKILPPELKPNLPRHEWAKVVRGHLNTRTIRRTNIVEVSYRSRDAKAAVAMVNAVVDSYLEFIEKNHRSDTAEISTLLTNERFELETQLKTKEKQLSEARQRNRIFTVHTDDTVVHPLVEQVSSLNKQLIQVRERRVQLEASLTTVQNAVKHQGDLRQHLLNLQPSVGREFILNSLGLNPAHNEELAAAERQIAEDRGQLAALTTHLGHAHPRITSIAQRVRSTEFFLNNHQREMSQRMSQIHQQKLGKMLLALLGEEISKSRHHESKLQIEFARAEASAVNQVNRIAEITEVEHDLTRLRSLYDVLMNRLANIDINQESSTLRVRPISEPTTPKKPVSPQLAVVVILCLVIGSGAGSLTVHIMDVMDERFRSPEELRDQLGAPVLAMVRKHQQHEGMGIDALEVHVRGQSPESESFRTLRTALTFSRPEATRIAISSSEPGDGKTTVIANLAASFAQAGRKIILIDGDLRRPGLSNLFLMRKLPGFSDILRAEEEIGQMCANLVQPTAIDGLDVLPCGPRPVNPGELLAGTRCGELFAWAETVYDLVLIDSPPALAASDTAILGRIVDGIILVVQPEKNDRRRVIRAVESLTSMGTTLIGTVVNLFGAKTDNTYYGYYSGYDYDYGIAEAYSQDDPSEMSDESSSLEDEETLPATISLADYLKLHEPNGTEPSQAKRRSA